MPLGFLDVTNVLDAVIYSGPAWIAAYLGWRNKRAMKVPSGGTLGEKMERTYEHAAAGSAGVKVIADAMTSGEYNVTRNHEDGGDGEHDRA